MKVELTTSLTLHGVTVEIPITVQYRFSLWGTPMGIPELPIVEKVTFAYMDGVDIDLTPIYDRHPRLLAALARQLSEAVGKRFA